MRIFDRYILKSFAVPFLYCLGGFLAIWILYDLGDNGQDFFESGLSFWEILEFYWRQLPMVLVEFALPISILLSLLYSLARMSRHNELISMLAAGVSVPRLLAPIFLLGLGASALSWGLNRELVAGAMRYREERLERVNSEGARKSRLYAVVYFHRAGNRFWYIRALDSGDMTRAKGVQIVQVDPAGVVLHKYYVRQALFDPSDGSWRLEGAHLLKFDEGGRVASRETLGDVVVRGWGETPRQIVGASVKPSLMGVTGLREYLRMNESGTAAQLAPYRTQLHYRGALPWNCLVVVCIAGPLGFIYSRRGMLTNVMAAIVLFFAFLLATHLFVALGEGARIGAWIAAWMPSVIFLGLGGVLLYLRGTNRELPDIRLPSLRPLLGGRRVWASR